MPLDVLKLKTENKNVTRDYMTGTGKNIKSVCKLKKINNRNQNSLRFSSREFIVSVTFSISITFRLRSSITLFSSVA